MIFDIVFKADLHTEKGRNIAAAAHCRLRPGEIDNLWKDTVGHGEVGGLQIHISRTNTSQEWTVAALGNDDYDREAAAALREEVLAAVRENASEFKELRSDLYDGG